MMKRGILAPGITVILLLAVQSTAAAQQALDLIGRWRLYPMMSLEGPSYTVSIPEEAAAADCLFLASGEYQQGPRGGPLKTSGYWLLDVPGQRIFVAATKTATKSPDYAFSVLSADALLLTLRGNRYGNVVMSVYLAIRDVPHPAIPEHFMVAAPPAQVTGSVVLDLPEDYEPMSDESLKEIGFYPGKLLEGSTYQVATAFGYARANPFSMVFGFTTNLDILGQVGWDRDLGEPAKLAGQVTGEDALAAQSRGVQIGDSRGALVAWEQTASGVDFTAEMVVFRRVRVAVVILHMRFNGDAGEGYWPDLAGLAAQLYGQLPE